ncbi:MAG: sugar ABC transporter permease [Clostridia bacterium]|nr:sugar ABC transporter permease [Clostridia bacterium]
MLPALAFYVIFMAYPLVDSIRLSFFTGNLGSRAFVGLQNFSRLFTDPELSARFGNAFKNTSIFFTVHMLVQNVLGILFAVLLTNSHMRGRKLYQTIIFVPTTFAVLVTGYLWKLLLNPVWSKPFLASLGLQALAKPWLGTESTALIFVALVSCWQWIGIPTMMFVAALRNISEDIYEAADIDGASGWQVFWHIKMPLLKPVIGMITILTFVNNFNAFDIVYAMENANGAPGYATDLIGTLFYRLGIAGQHPIGIPDPGMGATVATLMFIMLAAVSFLILRKTQTKE